MIYLIATADRAFCKVGRSQDPSARLASLQSAWPIDLHLIATRDVPDQFEQVLHKAFRKERLRGEWFRYSDALVDKFRSLPINFVPDDEVPEVLPIFTQADAKIITDGIVNPIEITRILVRVAITERISPAGLARRAGLHRNALYGADLPEWDPKASTLLKLWPHLLPDS